MGEWKVNKILPHFKSKRDWKSKCQRRALPHREKTSTPKEFGISNRVIEGPTMFTRKRFSKEPDFAGSFRPTCFVSFTGGTSWNYIVMSGTPRFSPPNYSLGPKDDHIRWVLRKRVFYRVRSAVLQNLQSLVCWFYGVDSTWDPWSLVSLDTIYYLILPEFIL